MEPAGPQGQAAPDGARAAAGGQPSAPSDGHTAAQSVASAAAVAGPALEDAPTAEVLERLLDRSSAEHQAHLASARARCVERIRDFFRASPDRIAKYVDSPEAGAEACGECAETLDARVDRVLERVLFLHPPVYTCEEAEEKCQPDIPGCAMKNLFLRDKKKNFFLVSALVDSVAPLKDLPLKGKQGSLKFANEKELLANLGLLPGSVTPFGLLSDASNRVAYYCDQAVWCKERNASGQVNFHPNSCDATVALHVQDFIDFMETEARHDVTMLELEQKKD